MYDICIIGAGSGGLSVAAGAAQLGLKTVLIEKAEMGGDCLNTGCVPSKALLAAAKRAQTYRKGNIKGIKAVEPDIDFAAVKDYVHDVIAKIEPNDSQERFEKLGVTVIRSFAQFIDKYTVDAGGQKIQARYFVIATGSRPLVPPITDIDRSKIYTNETIFNLREKPSHLVIIGGGPIGIEMAQAHRRLGCKVTVLNRGPIMPRDDEACVAVVREALLKEGVEIFENASPELSSEKVKIASHVLLAAGRKSNVENLGLHHAGITTDERGIIVDARLRTKQKHIFAIGDVSGGPQFTHIAGYHAGIVIRNICFKISAKVDYKALPWVTYCDPELAQVGLTEKLAREMHGDDVKVAEWHFAENDRAIAEAADKGLIRVITNKKGLILGASIVGMNAGDLIGLWALAITNGLKISAVTSMIAPYPTLSEVSKRAAGAWYTEKLFSDKTRKIVRLLQWLPF